MADIKVECTVEFDKAKKTATLIQKKDGHVTKLTIFADSDKENPKSKKNSIFDANDRYVITNAEGKKLKNPKLNAGAVARFLTAIDQKNASENIGLKKIKNSGKMFKPDTFEANGCEYEITTAGTLCEAAKKFNVPPSRGNHSTSVSTHDGGIEAGEDTVKAELAATYNAIQNKKMILNQVLSSAQQLQQSMACIGNPYGSMAQMTFAANGFMTAAALTPGIMNSASIKAFEAAAGISIQDAIGQVNALEQKLKNGLEETGLSMAEVLGANSPIGGSFGSTVRRVEEKTAEEVDETDEAQSTTETEEDETETVDDDKTESTEASTADEAGKKPIGAKDLEKFYDELKSELGLEGKSDDEIKEFDAKVRNAILNGTAENKNEIKKLILELIDLKKDYSKNSDDIEKQAEIENQIKEKTKVFMTLLNNPKKNVQEKENTSVNQTTSAASEEQKKASDECNKVIETLNSNLAMYTPQKCDEYKGMIQNVLQDKNISDKEKTEKLMRLAKMGQQMLVGYEKAKEIDKNGRDMAGVFESNSKYIVSGEAINKVDINKNNVLETMHAYYDMLGSIRGHKNLIQQTQSPEAIKTIAMSLIERLIENPQLSEDKKIDLQNTKQVLLIELNSKKATQKAKDITGELLTMAREIEYKDFR